MSISKTLIWIIGIYSILVVSFVAFLNVPSNNQPDRAIVMMGLGLIIFWVIIGGSIMYKLRDKAKTWFNNLPGSWPVKFVLFATALALIEEIITVTMSNLAPVFGSEKGVAFITASTNYFHTVLFHSVILFIPMFIGIVFVVRKYDFSVGSVFLMMGLIGSLAEVWINPAAIISGFWFFVYGLFVFLPMYSIIGIPERKKLRKPGFWAYVQLFIFPQLFTIPVAVIVGLLRIWLEIPLLI